MKKYKRFSLGLRNKNTAQELEILAQQQSKKKDEYIYLVSIPYFK